VSSRTGYPALIALALTALLVAGSCGGGDSDATTPDTETVGMTVSIASAQGVGKVLVDANGAALYAADQESDGVVRCLGACIEVWEPLTVTGEPIGAGTVGASLGYLTRPDGTRHVTFLAIPLYRFARDPGPRTVTGNGISDKLAGQTLTWHVVTPAGPSTSKRNSGKPRGDYEGGYGG
jgi:predicted lipoprotein with Yx(FWY)xxD motif